MATDYDALSEQLNDDSDTDNESSSDDEYDDYSDAPILNVSPQVALGFDEILEAGMMGGHDEEQNIKVANGYGNNAVVVLKNAEVLDGTLYSATNGHPADYKLVDTDSDSIEVDYNANGEAEGIRVHGNKFESEEVDGFGEDVVRLMDGSSSGMRLLQLLDSRGGLSAYYNENGDKSGGLIEYPPEYNTDGYSPSNGNDRYPRVVRLQCELREDMMEQAGVLFYYQSDEAYNGNHMTKVSVFNGDADPTNEIEPQSDGREPDYLGYLEWDEPDADGGSDEGNANNADDSDDGETVVSTDAFGTATDDSDDTPVTYENLGENDQTFVDTAVEEGLTVEKHNLDDTYEQFVADNGYEGEDTETIVSIVEERQ
jgi:hypothetical protein